MINLEEQKNLFIEIARRLKERMEVYAIGGTALIFYGLKELTLDIDLVFLNKKDREIFKEAAKSLGYKEADSKIVYGARENIPEMISLADSRLDLFLDELIDFKFSQNMKNRALQIHEFGKNLVIRIADIHDIILMKCATNRIKDEDDIINLVRDNKIDWNVIVKEAEFQVSIGKALAFLELGSLLEKLKNKHKLDIPKSVLDKIWLKLKKQIDAKLKRKKL